MKTIRKVEDEQLQKFHDDEAQRTLLSVFTSGLAGNPGQQVIFRTPQTVDEALHIAITFHEAKDQQRRNSAFFSASENPKKGREIFGHPRRMLDANKWKDETDLAIHWLNYTNCNQSNTFAYIRQLEFAILEL
jgi:hypothetical protein